jgi:hypothetical protein
MSETDPFGRDAWPDLDRLGVDLLVELMSRPERGPVSTPGRENRRGRPRGYSPWRPRERTQALLENVAAVLEEYQDHLPLTIRQIFYRLVGQHGYPKDERAYKRLAEHLGRARRARMIDFDVIRDDGVVTYSSPWHDGPEAFWDATAERIRGYRRDRQAGQRKFVELWCEAAGMAPQLARVADAYSIPVFSAGGFASLTAVRLMATRALSRDVPTVLMHVGDFDPSGDSIFDAMTADAAAFVVEDRVIGTQRIEPVRVALTAAQVASYQLPTSPPKLSDKRAKRWTGGGTCQLEALPPDVLATLVKDALEAGLNLDLVIRQVEVEVQDRTQLLRALPRGEDQP